MNLKVKLPAALMHLDNIGSIYLPSPQMSSQQTKYIESQRHGMHGMKEIIKYGFIKILFLKSEDKHSDIFMMNLRSKLHFKQGTVVSTKMIGKLNINDSYIEKNYAAGLR